MPITELKKSSLCRREWHLDPRVAEVRKCLQLHIFRLFQTLFLKSDKKSLDPAILPAVKGVEDFLFQDAASLEEYSDTRTLKNRFLRAVKLNQDAIRGLVTKSKPCSPVGTAEMTEGAWVHLPGLKDIYKSFTTSTMQSSGGEICHMIPMPETSQIGSSLGCNIHFSSCASSSRTPYCRIGTGETSTPYSIGRDSFNNFSDQFCQGARSRTTQLLGCLPPSRLGLRSNLVHNNHSANNLECNGRSNAIHTGNTKISCIPSFSAIPFKQDTSISPDFTQECHKPVLLFNHCQNQEDSRQLSCENGMFNHTKVNSSAPEVLPSSTDFIREPEDTWSHQQNSQVSHGRCESYMELRGPLVRQECGKQTSHLCQQQLSETSSYRHVLNNSAPALVDMRRISELGDTITELKLQARHKFFHAYMHGRSCTTGEECRVPTCKKSKEIIMHSSHCHDRNCGRFRCHEYQELMNRYCYYSENSCLLCRPVPTSCQAKEQLPFTGEHRDSRLVQQCFQDPPLKRRKVCEFSSTNSSEKGSLQTLLPFTEEHRDSQSVQQCFQEANICTPATLKSSSIPLEEELTGLINGNDSDEMMDVLDIPDDGNMYDASDTPEGILGHKGGRDMSAESCISYMEGSHLNIGKITNSTDGPFIEKPEDKEVAIKIMEGRELMHESAAEAVAMTDFFSLDQIKEHIKSLRDWTSESKAEAVKFHDIGNLADENSCKLCGGEALKFEPPIKYCNLCSSMIRHNAVYHVKLSRNLSGRIDGEMHYFCNRCYMETRNENFKVDGIPVDKFKLEKRKNNDTVDEPWVQCDKCEGWQHVVCALFNSKRNEEGLRYICPICYINELESGKRNPLPESLFLGAKDIPSSSLSDHIECRLFKSLKEERQQRALVLGQKPNEVPTAENLVVRVVSSVDKRVKVRQRFQKIFPKENCYPDGFVYNSKAITLFQKIEGVDVLLFTMYIQEFGSDCDPPNQRRVYLSYLDSVKYFCPNIKASTGEALRTFVYHEILNGYLEYIKNRGFTSMYIWACPPLKGEGYIFHCHPEVQKTPKDDKLREWYKTIMHKAMEEDIVVGFNNLYDQFFVSDEECKTKVTAARLPYFDGDYLPSAIDDTITSILKEEEEAKLHKKLRQRAINKRALKAAGHGELSADSATDIELMQKLGEKVHQNRECFIIAHLQHECSHCSHYILSGKRWDCVQCKDFHLCASCYFKEKRIPERERHPRRNRVKHRFHLIQWCSVPRSTKDEDPRTGLNIFESRHTFLDYCQQNNLQYDSLRRAKHSSMMVLHHMHEWLKLKGEHNEGCVVEAEDVTCT